MAKIKTEPEIVRTNPLEDFIPSEPRENLPATQGASAPAEKSDFITPKLNLVQKIGDLSALFTAGTWVLNKETQLTKAVGDPLQIVVLERPYKYYMEHLDYDPEGPRPRLFTTPEEVAEAGLTLEWDNENNIRPTADRGAKVLMLIIKPDSPADVGGFGLRVDGLGLCALAAWNLTGTAYKTAARRLFTAEQMDLNGEPFYSIVWNLRSQAVKSGKYTVLSPQLIVNRRLDATGIAAVKTKLNLS